MSDTFDPAVLKLELAMEGLRLDDSARATLVSSGEVPALVNLRLEGGLRVAVPAALEVGAPSPFLLTADAGRFVLHRNDSREPERLYVLPQPSPRFYGRRTSTGKPMWRIATVHGPSLLVDPAGACGFSVRGAPCAFCLEGARPSAGEEVPTVAEVVEVVRAAFDEGAAQQVLFHGAFANGEDGGIATLVPYVEGIRRHFDTLVAAQVHPPRDDRWIDRAYALGIDALSLNLELFDPDALRRHCVGRARYIGRDRYLDALAYAARVFPRGTVWTDLVVGIESLDATREGIDALTAAGVIPVIAAIRRPSGVASRAVPTAEDLRPLLAHLYRRTREQRLPMRWLRDLTGGVVPLEARGTAGDPARFAVAAQSLARSRLGGVATRGLARARRRLRVQSLGESDSGH